MLGSLIDNALRHTPKGGRIEIRGSLRDRAVEFSVSDPGEGISAEHLPHIFERIYRADSARDRASGGSGIGLAVVRAIVELHGAEGPLSTNFRPSRYIEFGPPSVG